MTFVTDDEWWLGPIADEQGDVPFHDRKIRFTGRVWSIASDVVEFPGGSAERDIVLHPGAVAVMAVDDDDRVLLIRQYRHPVGMWLFEPPAGLLDVAGEHPWRTAQRELAEEAGFVADRWQVLVDAYLTPGGSSEAIRIYLARGLRAISGGREHTGEAEEALLPRVWVPLEQGVELVLSGAIGSPTSILGLLALRAAQAGGWVGLRPADAPWPARDCLLASDRLPADLG